MHPFEGHTGKKRFGMALVGSLGLTAGMIAALLSGGIAVADISTAFAFPFKAHVGSLTGHGLEQYAWFLNNSKTGKQNVPTVETYLHSADLNDLTQTFCVPLGNGLTTPAADILSFVMNNGGADGFLGEYIDASNFGGLASQRDNVPTLELALHGNVHANGMLADILSQNDVTLLGVQANVPFNTTLGNGATYNTNTVTPPQDPVLGSPDKSPLTYAETVTNPDGTAGSTSGAAVDQYITYQYAQSLTLHNPTFTVKWGYLHPLHAAIYAYDVAHSISYPYEPFTGFDGGKCDWQLANMPNGFGG